MIVIPFLPSANITTTTTANPCWCRLWLTVVILFSPSLVLWSSSSSSSSLSSQSHSSSSSSVILLVNAYRCSRCSSSTSQPVFPAYLCKVAVEIDDDDPNIGEYGSDPFYQGYLPSDFGDCLPQDKFPCVCPEADGVSIIDFRYPFTCDYSGPTDNPSNIEENEQLYAPSSFGSCECSPEYSQNICVPGKCDYAFQCEDEMYVCWDGISPQDLGLDNDICDNNELTAVKYCYDTLDHPYQVQAGGYECGVEVCNWDQDLVGFYLDQFDSTFPGPSKTPEDLLRNNNYICPNGKQITRIIEFCSPNNVNPPFNDCDGSDCTEECDLNFCDFGNDDWKLTKTTAPVTSITCPENIEQNNIPLLDLGAIITYPTVTADSLDTCRNGEQIQSNGFASGELFPFGTTTNIFTDGNGKVTCSFTVTVTPTIVTSLLQKVEKIFNFLFGRG